MDLNIERLDSFEKAYFVLSYELLEDDFGLCLDLLRTDVWEFLVFHSPNLRLHLGGGNNCMFWYSTW